MSDSMSDEQDPLAEPGAEAQARPQPDVPVTREPEPTRRLFLGLTAVGATIAATGGMAWWATQHGPLRRALEVPAQGELPEPPPPLSETGVALATMLVDKLDMLKLPETTVAQWVHRYEQHKGPWTRKKVSRKVLQNFLLSTDFFPAADESKPLRFVAYYDPYISVCYNPLRRAD
jgi:hypothetical protein